MGFRIFYLFPNFTPRDLCRMTAPGEHPGAAIWERNIPFFAPDGCPAGDEGRFHTSSVPRIRRVYRLLPVTPDR